MYKLFQIYGIAVMALLALAHWTGWAWVDLDRLRDVPRSVRDNPGSYRSVYTHYTHYTGGK